MNSDNIVARIDATFENTLQLNAELGEVTQIGKCKVLCGTTEEWNNQPELVAKEGYIYIYSDHKQNEDEQNIASFKVGDGSSLLIELPFTDDIIYEDITALQTVVADIPTTASELPYDNSISELEATNTNDAIDEVVDMVNDKPDTASELPYDNTISGLESTNVNDAIDEVEVRVDEAEEDIVSLGTDKADKVDPTTSGALSHTGNATVSGTVTAQNGFIGNLTGTASSATHAVAADSATNATNATHATSADSATHATSASSADEATHATSADSATSATSATNADYATTAGSATHATSADSATSATNAGNANTVNNLTVLTAVPANAVFADTTYTLGTDGNTIKLIPSSGSAQSITAPYASNAGTVNSHSVNADVPSGAKFTDTDNLVDLKDVDFTNLTNGQVIVWDAISEKFKNITLPDAMVFRGSLGTGGTISILPVDGSASVGDTYKVITDGTYAGQVAKVGDTFICLTKTSSANTWVHIPSGDEPSGTVTSIKIEGSGAIVVDDESAITTSGVRTISHANSGATAGSYGDSSAQTPAYGATFKVPYITVDAKGHITGISEHTVKIPESDTINVVANPSGTATTDLTKIQVGNDIYAIPEGGTDVEVTQIQSTGTKIATITVDNVPTDLYAPEGGGSGGHTILNDSGISLTQRDDLQFKGAYSEDDSTSEKTIVNVARTMTLAEFEELSDAEKTGFINVKDETSGSDDKFQPIIYSEEEREIGVWIDGKPLYEKTYIFNKNDLHSSTISSNNIRGQLWLDQKFDKVWIEQAFLFNTNADSASSTTDMIKSSPSNYPYGSAFTRSNIQRVDTVNNGNDYIWFENNYSGSQIYNQINTILFIFILRYTKTTDQAGSGQWTPQGVPAVHYSTEEHIVGTWIDGKTLYERTIDNTYGTDLSNIDIEEIVGYDADSTIALRNNGTYMPCGAIISGNAQYSFCFTFSKDANDKWSINLRNTSGVVLSWWRITIRYTKTNS